MSESATPPRASGAGVPISVNGDPREVPAGSTVADLLQAVGVGGRRVAVARNRSVVPASRREQVVLAAGDRIEILEAVGGG